MTLKTWRSRQGRAPRKGSTPTRLRDVLAGQAPEGGEGRVTALAPVAGRADRVLLSVDSQPLGILSDVEAYRRELVVGMRGGDRDRVAIVVICVACTLLRAGHKCRWGFTRS